MNRFALLIAACIMSLPFAVQAQVPAPAAAISALDQGLIEAMRAGKSTPFQQRYAMLAPLVQNAFDLEAILQTSVGPRWQSFTPEQQGELQNVFMRFTVASYVSNFSSYGGEAFAIDPTLRDVGEERVVSTHIVNKGADIARIDYVMRQTPAGWRAVDVLLDGSISRVAVQRSDFRSQLEGGPEALVATLRKKVADLSGNASAL